MFSHDINYGGAGPSVPDFAQLLLTITLVSKFHLWKRKTVLPQNKVGKEKIDQKLYFRITYESASFGAVGGGCAVLRLQRFTTTHFIHQRFSRGDGQQF